MDIKTLISLKQKMNKIKLNFKNQNFFEILLGIILSGLFFLSMPFIAGFTLNFILSDNFLYGMFSFVGGISFLILSLFGFLSFHKLFEKDKSTIHKIISNRFSENIKFNRSELVENFIKELTEEEILLLKKISEIKKINESHFDIFEQQILKYAKNANKEELDFILNSINNKELRYQILEISQYKVEEKLHINKQTVIKNI